VPTGKLFLREHPWRYFWHDIRTHYPHSKGVIGRSIFYGIYLPHSERVGVIGIQSVSQPMKAVIKEVYGVDKMTPEVKRSYLKEIVSNDIFRLYVNEPNLATRILSLFVKQIRIDFYKKYEVRLRGIISLSYGMNKVGSERKGMIYKAANWHDMGLSKGAKKTWMNGKYVYKSVSQKHVWLWHYPVKHDRKPRPTDFQFPKLPEHETLEKPTVER
jgi:hypothetical protein